MLQCPQKGAAVERGDIALISPRLAQSSPTGSWHRPFNDSHQQQHFE
ncbi:hypothetical protein RB213_006735, partial [Colletotrichum asianum]